MRTNACPHCNEIIPADVDYCPFCGNSTRENLRTDDDDLVASRTAERAAVAEAPPSSDFEKQPPVDRPSMCVLCYVEPATIGDYCEACNDKLNLKPEHWDAINRQKAIQAWVIYGIVALLILIVLVVVISHHRH